MPAEMRVTPLEHYKRVCSMLDAFMKRMEDTFRFFVQVSTAVIGGFIWLKMQPDSAKVAYLLEIARYIIPALGVATIAEMVNCLFRWYGYRKAEHRLNPRAPAPSIWMMGHVELIRILVTATVAVAAYRWLR
ncbi:hypothetical protein JJB98_09355 [Bradyrhizobium diazoefficiens]|nr:hypothetical protein [Bradyrhizobium diazoefficiens]QQO20104.1 hypothetical protein JJB98_09355 [Bradyrhizobium diazoefficiens]